MTDPDAPRLARASGPTLFAAFDSIRIAAARLAEREQAAEAQRLAALDSYHILDTPPEQVFDDLVRLVSELLGFPIAAMNLVAADRQWSKSQIGLGTQEMPLEVAFCPKAIRLADTLIVPDATQDPRFADNPLVTGPKHLRFYAGEVLHSREGYALGAFCVADTHAHPAGLDARQLSILKTLARQVVGHLELRRTAEEYRAEAVFLRGVVNASAGNPRQA